MPTYVQSNVIKTYDFAANPPVRDKVVFTIDHMHQGGSGLYSTFDVVQFLVSKQIPVAVFIQCTDPLNLCPVERTNASLIHNLAPHLVSLGAHSLSPGNSQLSQRNNLSLIQNVIADTTGLGSRVMSYHGSGAGPESGISYANIDYARGIKTSLMTQTDNPLDTPVMGLNSVDSAFSYTRTRNLADLSATLFVHSSELRNGTTKKRVFDTFVKEVSAGRLQAVSYQEAMRSDFPSDPVTPTDPVIPTNPSPSSCPPLSHFTNNVISQNLRKNDRDGRNGITQVAQFQRFLNELSLNAGIADGIFGNNTKLAAIGYQILKGLVPDGIIGSNTRTSINAFCV
jgi:imidazoleglycerol phosphate synthase glutamine amidotransferase subunit HisH